MTRRNVRLLAAVGAVVVGASAVLVPVTVRLVREDAAAGDLEADLRAHSSGPLTVTRAADGAALRAVGTRPGSPIRVGGADPAATFLDRYGRLLGADDDDLVPIGREPTLAGGMATRYQQTVDGVPVVGGEVSVQVDADGNILSSLADLSSAAPVADTTPTVRPLDARRAAVTATARAMGADPSTLAASAPEPWIYDPTVIGPASAFPPRLTWRTEVTSTSAPVRQLVLVDAEDGTIALSFSELALGLERKVCDAANTRQSQACVAPYARVEGQPPLNADTNPATANEVDLVYDYSGATYAFYAARFGRDGIADDGAPVVSKVRFCGTSSCPYNNAFWNGRQLTFGQGYARADDVVAHELTHGVTEHTANLFYWYQSGAINESMSDVFGEFVDQTDGVGTDTAGVRWRVGEDLPGGAIRNMANPTTAAYSDPDRMTSALYAADSSGLDAGGAHSNSGVGNRAAVLMTDGGTFNGQTVTGLGIPKSAAIYYEALTTMLTSASDYADLGVALSQACRNLVGGGAGITNGNCTQVDVVVVATEMASQPTAGGSAAPTAPEAPVCDAGLEPVDLFADDMEDRISGRWSFDTVNVPDVSPDDRWAYQSEVGLEYATSGVDGLWGPDNGRTADRRIQMTQAVALPVGSPAFLHFRHAYGFESSSGINWDGGVVEYTIDNGLTWNDLGPLFAGAEANGYNGALVGGGTNPLAGRSAFVGTSHGYVSSRANLLALAGQSVRLRFRLGEDEEVGTPYGWFVDDLRLYTCAPVAHVAVAQSADQSSVVAGTDVDLHLTVHNTGGLPLTNLHVADPAAPDCEDDVLLLAPDATHTIDCTHATVDPDDVGMWTNVVTVTATELSPAGVASDPLTVEVVAPTPSIDATLDADETIVTVGDVIHLHTTVHNDGNVALTGASVTVAGCDEPLADLAVDANVTVDCDHTTIDPDDLGAWSATAAVSADQFPTPVASNSVGVTVLAPDVTDPTITLTTPAEGAVYNQGQAVAASFSCADERPGPVSCDGTVADGQPIETSTPGDHTFTITAHDAAGNDAVPVAHTYTVAVRRPDGRIRLGAAGTTVGDNRYRESGDVAGTGQTRIARIPRGAQVTFFVTVQNDGTHPEAFRVRGQPSTADYPVRYLSAGVDITAKARNGTYRTPVLAPGAVRTIKVIVTVGARAAVGSHADRLVTISSASDPLVKDVVRFVVRRR